MDRRTAMFLTLLLGGLAPRGLRAQSAGRRASSSGSSATKARTRSAGPAPIRRARGGDDEIPENEPAADPPVEDETPANLPPEPGHQWAKYDIGAYTSLAHSQNNPQTAIIDWIFRRTGTAAWHGDKVAVLSASRTQLRAYHNANVLQKVDDVVQRFVDATHDLLSVRVRFVAAENTSWRHTVYSRLTPVLSGPQGQQVWTMKTEESALVLTQMQVYRGFRLLTDQKVEMVNGQTLMIKTSETRTFTGGLQRESVAGMGLQPSADQLEEGVTLRLSPLLHYEGDQIEAAIDLTANTVKSFHRTRIIAPREIGPSEVTLDVPEVVESRLNKTVNKWPLGQTLLISAGIQPGILQSKAGFLGLRVPGTVPTQTELLVFLDVEAVGRGKAARERE